MNDFYFKADSGEWELIKEPVEDIDSRMPTYADDNEYISLLQKSLCFEIELDPIVLKLRKLAAEETKCFDEAQKNLIKAFARTGLYSAEALKQYGIELVGNEPPVEMQIKNLERRKKHCKNYLELKQIDRELNSLKYGRRKNNG